MSIDKTRRGGQSEYNPATRTRKPADEEGEPTPSIGEVPADRTGEVPTNRARYIALRAVDNTAHSEPSRNPGTLCYDVVLGERPGHRLTNLERTRKLLLFALTMFVAMASQCATLDGQLNPLDELAPATAYAQEPCLTGTSFNTATSRCEAVPLCPAGASLNTTTNACEATPSCPAGSVSVPSHGCEVPPTCSTGTTLLGGLCSASPSCPTGSTLTSVQCTTPPFCRVGNLVGRDCLVPFSCPSGMNFITIFSELLCRIAPPSVVCPVPGASLECSTVPPICPGVRIGPEWSQVPRCPVGFVRAATNCTAPVQCPIGTALNGQTCTSTSQCPVGATFNGQACSSPALCVSGTNFTGVICTALAQCPTGSLIGGLCTSMPQCPAGTVVSVLGSCSLG